MDYLWKLLQAGIPQNCLLISLEPEAASIYCQYLPTEKFNGIESGFTVTDVGTKYMVVDLGGLLRMFPRFQCISIYLLMKSKNLQLEKYNCIKNEIQKNLSVDHMRIIH